MVDLKVETVTKFCCSFKMKGREPKWSNPKSSTGNCMNCTKNK